jgi:ADP-ribosylglycohydrolase
MEPFTSAIKGFFLGSMIGNALGLPANKRPHHFIRMYFKGIKGYTDEYYSTATATGFRLGQTAVDARPILKRINKKTAVEVWVNEFMQVESKDLIISVFESLASVKSTEPEAILFAIAMLLRNAEDFETAVLSTVNMGGLSSLTGALVGGAIGMVQGIAGIPEKLIEGLEYSEEIKLLFSGVDSKKE